MGDTKIGWTNKTWNPVTGCSKVSQGCRNCYAETLSLRYGWSKKPWAERFAAENVVLHPERLDAPLKWRKPSMCFVNSMSDLFHEEIPDEFIAGVFAVMRVTPQHTYQVLTKRPERMRSFVSDPLTANWIQNKAISLSQNTVHWRAVTPWRNMATSLPLWPLPNVWLGVSVENQHWADVRVPVLLDTPAAVRFVSYEPALGPVRFANYMLDSKHRRVQGFTNGLSWIIAGAESGPKRRPFDNEWARAVKRQCDAAGVPAFMKQGSGLRPGMPFGDPELDGAKAWPR